MMIGTVYISYWWKGCYIWYSKEGPRCVEAPTSPLLVVPNVTNSQSRASVQTFITSHYGTTIQHKCARQLNEASADEILTKRSCYACINVLDK